METGRQVRNIYAIDKCNEREMACGLEFNERYLPPLTECNTGFNASLVVHLSLQAMFTFKYPEDCILRQLIGNCSVGVPCTFTKRIPFIAWTTFKVHKFLC